MEILNKQYTWEQNRLNLVAAIFLASLWLMYHPFKGIYHDAIVYTATALRHLNPQNFSNDLFFKYGSQDKFTLFTPIYAKFITLFGIYKSSLILCILGQLLWIVSIFLFFKTIVKQKTLWLALAIAFVDIRYYGAHSMFKHAEPFLTPRLFSEALSLLALSFLFKRKLFFASIFFLLAGVLHPIMALVSICFGYVYLVLVNRKALWLAPLGIILITVLSMAGIDPFSRIFNTIPSDWYKIIEDRNSWLFITKYSVKDWSIVLFNSAILVSASWFSDDKARRIFISCLLTVWISLLINIIFAELFRIEFFMQIQIWRTLWLLNIVSVVAASILLVKLRTCSIDKIFIITLFILTWQCQSMGLGWIGICSTLVLIYLFWSISKNNCFNVHKYFKIAFYSSVIAIVGLFVFLGVKTILNCDKFLFPSYVENLFNLITPPFFVLLFILLYSSKKFLKLKYAFLVVCIFLISTGFWDRQTKQSKYIEQYEGDSAFFRDVIPTGATVYWDTNSKLSYLGTKRSGYVNGGIVFSRDTAIELKKRVENLEDIMGKVPLESEEQNSSGDNEQTKFEENIHKVCQRDNHPDFIVSAIKVENVYTAHWHSPITLWHLKKSHSKEHEVEESRDFYLYDCEEIAGRGTGFKGSRGRGVK